ncbi:hypothetical protein BDB00DRAFT_848207 [Zychaea mexicana]|uniref:uncharacterized protein n=1 Tax=Zychaea mexicana TaxID=64656 RepID=UPI0022FEB154|nr:uncharacterized protein BDB00DRAFT_848207 [Zychaea mexicana]KAI9488376.1 hypothetical protein BDB00DRAFT_848207 [Zychaea mexicana]
MAAITAYNSEQDQETTPLLLSNRHPTDSTTTPKEMKSRSDAIFGAATHVGLALFVGLIISVLVRIPFNVFTYHPIFIMLFIVFTTEGIVLATLLLNFLF